MYKSGIDNKQVYKRVASYDQDRRLFLFVNTNKLNEVINLLKIDKDDTYISKYEVLEKFQVKIFDQQFLEQIKKFKNINNVNGNGQIIYEYNKQVVFNIDVGMYICKGNQIENMIKEFECLYSNNIWGLHYIDYDDYQRKTIFFDPNDKNKLITIQMKSK